MIAPLVRANPAGHSHTPHAAGGPTPADAQPGGGGQTRRAWTIWALLLGTALLWDVLAYDLDVMRAIGAPTGFPWRDHPLLVRWGHDLAKQASALAYLGVLAVAALALWRRGLRDGSTRRWLEVATGVTLCVGAVALLKRISLTSCPWDLEMFGGVAHYVTHWRPGVADGGGAHCFPAGHVSAALAWWPLALAREARPWRIDTRWLLAVAVLGSVFGVVQTLRGAHYPSHTLWTAWLCWTLTLLNHAAWRVRPARRQTSTSTASP
ncbi:phosphatase PAP2 family protein [Tepidimonas sp.]|uniref:phosphatase PAP2 family protein n=1 Tax=Tepidimonas sp. TaxID=2002775 RepID=UPI002FDF708D